MNALLEVEREQLQRMRFCKKIKTLVGQLGYRIHTEMNWSDLERKFPVVGAVRPERLQHLRESLAGLGFGIRDIETVHFRGVYFEDTATEFGLFLAPQPRLLTMAQRIHNSAREHANLFELQSYGEANGLVNLTRLDYASANPLWIRMEHLIAAMVGLSNTDFLDIKAANSHREFIRYYLEFRNGQRTYAYRFGEYNSNIEIFARIYFWEIKVMGEILLPGQPISIHDAGTSVAQFPLLLSGLTPEQLFGIEVGRIWASDKGWTGEAMVRKIIRDHPGYHPVEFLQLDLAKDFEAFPRADVVVINDVLEHLPSDTVALNTLRELWQKTNQLLIAHVPLEEVPNSAWDHHISFNPLKLRRWADQLPGARFLSDDYLEDDQSSLTEHGYLIVKKEVLNQG